METEILWTETEVRDRLRKYSQDDALYDVYAARTSGVKYGYSRDSGGTPIKIYRLLKRWEVERAMNEALLPPDSRGARTKKEERKIFLYWLIKMLYINDWSMGTIGIITKISRKTLRAMENEAIGLITGKLNKKNAPPD